MLRWFIPRSIYRCPLVFYSTSLNSSSLNIQNKDDHDIHNKDSNLQNPDEEKKESSKIVAAAFASLKEISLRSKYKSLLKTDSPTNETASSSNIHQNVNSLLEEANNTDVDKYKALKIVATLSEWAQVGKVRMNDFSSDPRFIKLCRILSRFDKNISTNPIDLSVVLGVSASNYAEKFITSVGLPKMVKALSSFSSKKQRSIDSLRSISHSIASSSEIMNIKEASDVFYACASLSLSDDPLLQKASDDVLLALNDNHKPAVVTSLVKSAGILKYRNTRLLDSLCNWFVENKDHCGFKDFSTLLFTLANVNYRPDNLNQLIKLINPLLNEKANWEKIDSVWALLVLNECNEETIASVLNPNFINEQRFKNEYNSYTASKLKLLNINAFAKQLGSRYSGLLLDELSPIFNIPLVRTKDKTVTFNVVMETLANLVTLSDHVRCNVDLKMGFLIDAEFFIDSNKNIIKLEKNDETSNKVALMIVGYHDMCRGSTDEQNGITSLSHKILKMSGYKVLTIPYWLLSSKEKLLTRIQALGQRLKTIDDV